MLRALLVLRVLVLRALLEHLLMVTALLRPLLLLLHVLVLRALLVQQLLAPAPAVRAGNWCNRWKTIRSRTARLRWQLPVPPTNAACNAGSAPELYLPRYGLIEPGLVAPGLLDP